MSFIVPGLALLLGLWLVGTGLWRRPVRRVRVAIGATLVLMIVAEGSRMAYIDARLDLNPVVERPEVLAGVWRDGSTEIELALNGQWRCRTVGVAPCAGDVQNGRWSESDNTIDFDSAAGERVAQLLVVTYSGEFRLLQPFEDPDEWSYTLDFERVR